MLSRMLPRAVLLAGTLFIAPVESAFAQMPPDVAARVRALGRHIAEEPTAAIYAPLHAERAPYAGVKIVRDVSYGPDPRHKLDIFIPSDTSAEPRPVFVFLHGGGFVSGERRVTPAFYDNVGVWAARQGMLGVNMTYRLAPAHHWPAGAEDTGAAMQWLVQHVHAHGGDPARIFLAGHSAGAAHIADYIAFPALHPGPDGPGIGGAILLSGIFNVSRFPPYPFMRTYYEGYAPSRADASRLRGLLSADAPLLVAFAELDPPEFAREARALNEALCKARRCPRFAEFAGHNHLSEIYSINTDDTGVSAVLLDFIDGLQ